jgi:hypothetical protein
MKISSAMISKGSGSVAGLTLSRNRGGMYFRQRSMPTNPNTTLQVAIRSALGQLAGQWSSVLTSAEREAWNLYGANVAVLDALGETIYLTGQQQFIRSNVPRIQAGLSIITAGPTTFTLGDFSSPTNYAATTDGTTISFDVTSTDDWANEAGANMLVYQGKVVGPGKGFFKGPFRYLDKLAGSAVTPPTEFSSTDPVYALSEDNLVWTRVQVSRADGRLSQSLILGPATITGAP